MRACVDSAGYGSSILFTILIFHVVIERFNILICPLKLICYATLSISIRIRR